MKVLRCLVVALMIGMVSPIIAVAAPASLEVLEKQLRELQAQIEQLKQDKQQQDRRMREIEAAEKERAKDTEALRQQTMRQEEQERKTGILAEEMEAIKRRYLLPETVEYKSLYGLGPAASKVYHLPRGLSIGGYGEANAVFFMQDNDGPAKKRHVGDLVRFVTYIGYKFTDRIVLNSEIEFEHAKVQPTKTQGSGGDVEIEFATLDFLWNEKVNARAGLLLIPMGFLNELHEPPFYFGNQRPEVEQRIIPTTWRELGAGLHGTILPGLTYRTYVTNSLNAKGFTSSGIRSSRQNGSKAFFEDVAWTGRLDYTPFPGLLLGGSFFWGNTDQEQTFAGKKIDATLALFEGHAQYEYRGLRLRALYAQANLDNARTLSTDLKQSISRRMLGGYVEAAYDILPLIFPETDMSLSPFIRYEHLDTQADVPTGFTSDDSKDIEVINAGFSFKPIPNIVLKFDYRNLNADKGKVADEVTVGLGFIF